MKKNALGTAVCAAFLLAATIEGQTSPPFIFSALNSASYDSSGLAPGSLIVVFGFGMGPAALTSAPFVPLPPTLAGTAVTVTSGSITLNCPLLYTSDAQLAAVLPSATPPGAAVLSVTYNGAKGAGSTTPINVVASSVGIFTLNSSGSGAGIFTGLDNTLKTFGHAAHAGDVVTIWATGAGPSGGSDGGVPPSFPNFPGVEVLAGSQSATVIYAGRSGCCAAVDQISFFMPQTAAGCYVPVAVRSAGRVSNFVSLPVSGAGDVCTDSPPVIPSALVSRASTQQPVKFGILGVGPTGVLAGLGFHSRASVAAALTAALHVRVTEEDAGRILHAAQTGNRKGLARSLIKYSSAWKKLDPATRKHLDALLRFNQTGAYGAFVRYDSATVLGPLAASLFTPAGTCSVLPPGSPPLGSVTQGLDAGSALVLAGPGGPWSLRLRGSASMRPFSELRRLLAPSCPARTQ